MDVMLLMDGSGSIDSADWLLQKGGYAAALRDSANFPLDGSMAVGVVQWSAGVTTSGTRLEVPLTKLDSADTLNAVIAKIDAIEQLGSSTNPGDGIVAGTDELVAHGRSDVDWRLCMSTDGAINAGTDMATAKVYATGKGVDRYSVVAIEDGSFGAVAAESA